MATPEGKEVVKGKAQKRLEEILNGIDIQTQEEKNIIEEDNQTDEIIKGLEDKSKTNIDVDKLEEHISLTDFILKSLQKQNKAQVKNFSNTIMTPIYVSGFNDTALNFLANNLKYQNIIPYATGEFISNPVSNTDSDIRQKCNFKSW